MKKQKTLLYHITVFSLALGVWLIMLGVWIYWYVMNYVVAQEGGSSGATRDYTIGSSLALSGGIVLFVLMFFIIAIIFRDLNVQLKLNNLYDNFIGNITHELKSPLSSIQLYLETLNNRDVPAAKQKEFIALMMKDANRLKNLINTILEVSALEQKKLAHSYHVYNAGGVIKQLILESIDHFNIPLERVKIEDRANCECVIDQNALKIVFDNLTDNAIKYSVGELRLRVLIAKVGKKIAISFTDNGIGISGSDQKKVFDKFHRIYNREIPNVKGTGLGLFWVKEIVKAHGGKITLSSEGLNMGTTFRIDLPVYGKAKKRLLNNLLEDTIKREGQAE